MTGTLDVPKGTVLPASVTRYVRLFVLGQVKAKDVLVARRMSWVFTKQKSIALTSLEPEICIKYAV